MATNTEVRSVFERAAKATKRTGPRIGSNFGDSSMPEPSRPKKMKMSLQVTDESL